MLAANSEVVGSNHTEGKICLSHFTLIRVECEELFCKTNIKLLKQVAFKFYINYGIENRLVSLGNVSK